MDDSERAIGRWGEVALTTAKSARPAGLSALEDHEDELESWGALPELGVTDRWGEVVDAEIACSARAGPETPKRRPGERVTWSDVVDAEIHIVTHVLTFLAWAPLCALRRCHSSTLEAFELFTAQPLACTELCWVRVAEAKQRACLRFLAEHFRHSKQLTVRESARLSEPQLLRLVCGMRLLEALEVDASPFGGGFPDPQRLLERLAKYCPRLQHLTMSFRHEAPTGRHTLTVRTLSCLGRRLLTLDLGAVAVRVFGGTKTIAACCPLLERFCARLWQQAGRAVDVVEPADLAVGCKSLVDLDLAPVEWDDSTLRNFAAGTESLQALALRQVAARASMEFLEPLAERHAESLCTLHLALHVRSDFQRAERWLADVALLGRLRILCLDYAAPLRLAELCELALSKMPRLVALTVHGCHDVSDESVRAVAEACPRLSQLFLFPDSWRIAGTVGDETLRWLLGSLQLRGLALSSRRGELLADSEAWLAEARPRPRLRCFSLFAPLSDAACASIAWSGLRQVWLGPRKLMQRGVGFDCAISDEGVAELTAGCPNLVDLTIASQDVTDVGVRAVLTSCSELLRVRLGGRGITDASLQLLEALPAPRLERFALWFSGVSTAGASQAKEAVHWTYFDIEVADDD